MMTWRWLTIGLWLANALAAQSTSATGGYAGPNILSRFSRQSGTSPRGPVFTGYLHASYSYMDGLVGPTNEAVATPVLGRVDVNGASSQNLSGGGGLSLSRADSRGALTISYALNYVQPFSRAAAAYSGFNQDANIMYERQLTRRWGFYTGHSITAQSTLLGLTRPTAQRNVFEPAYSPTSEALDARTRSFNSGAGFFFQKSSRLTYSIDGSVFAVSRKSQALVGTRGERAQGELAYRFSRTQSIGAVYSFSHFYYPRGFGETYTQSVMLSYTRRLNRNWSLQASAGPYQANSERLRTVALDPWIAWLTGNASTIEVFKGVSRGIAGNASIGGIIGRRQNFNASYRRGIDAGNGLTLSALNDSTQMTYGYQTTRKLSMGVGIYYTRLTPVLGAAVRNADFQSYGGGLNASYRLINQVHLMGNLGMQNVFYKDLGINTFRKVATLGLAYSPGYRPLMR